MYTCVCVGVLGLWGNGIDSILHADNVKLKKKKWTCLGGSVSLNIPIELRGIWFVYSTLSRPWHPVAKNILASPTHPLPDIVCRCLCPENEVLCMRLWRALPTLWQQWLLGPFHTCIWEISKQMHTHLHFVGREDWEFKDSCGGNLCCSENLTCHRSNIKESV